MDHCTARSQVNFDQCLAEVRAGKWGSNGGTDNNGQPVSDISTATAITYSLCVKACGPGPEAFSWTVFSQQFCTWLLPWLSLLSQLPFGAGNRLDNLVSVFIAVGSPTLAAYSLALTVLNNRWVAHRFAAHSYPNRRNIVYVLKCLQQVPFRVTVGDGLLASLIVLPENDDWWTKFANQVHSTQAASISATISLAWAMLAYTFTLIDAFGNNFLDSVEASGGSIGTLWLWLLPIIIGWLHVTPKCESKGLINALNASNQIAHIQTMDRGAVHASTESGTRAISFDREYGNEVSACTTNNYTQTFSWAQNVDIIWDAFKEAAARAYQHKPVNPLETWAGADRGLILPANRRGNLVQVISYCGREPEKRGRWGTGVWPRCLGASVAALFLQWGTTGAAMIFAWFTPTRGLGCRCGGYLLYGAVSTFAWLMFLASSVFAHYSTHPIRDGKNYRKTLLPRMTRRISAIFYWLGISMATANAILIVVFSVFGLGSKAFDVLVFLSDDIVILRSARIGGIILAAGTTLLFIVFVYVSTDPSPEVALGPGLGDQNLALLNVFSM
ncbi:hypothetical protein BD779DRAFT_1677739 [Infundibulicybe gibba]|nr:hypothetical protein BD779DRAFT_1677739 [Infundibulicybe gibba]